MYSARAASCLTNKILFFCNILIIFLLLHVSVLGFFCVLHLRGFIGIYGGCSLMVTNKLDESCKSM
jgi:hypothetical protein